MMQTPNKWTALNLSFPGSIVRLICAWSFMIVLLCGLTVSKSASDFASIDHHSLTSVEASDDSAGSRNILLTCHPALTCTTFVLPIGAVTAFIPSYVVVSQSDFVEPQFRFGGPSVSLPPPRPLI